MKQNLPSSNEGISSLVANYRIQLCLIKSQWGLLGLGHLLMRLEGGTKHPHLGIQTALELSLLVIHGLTAA